MSIPPTGSALIALALTVAAQPALARKRPERVDATGMGVNYSSSMGSAYTGPKAMGRLVEVARCVVGRARGASEKLLEATPESNQEASIRWGPIKARLDQCSKMYMAATGVVLRGALAQVLYEERFGPKPPTVAAAVAPPPFEWPAKGQTSAQLATIYDFAGCVVAADPVGARNLVLAIPGSDDESAALRTLRPRFAPCLVRDVTFNTNRETLRAVLAESLYRWSLAQLRVSPQSGGAA
jgi:hypothetical protein